MTVGDLVLIKGTDAKTLVHTNPWKDTAGAILHF